MRSTMKRRYATFRERDTDDYGQKIEREIRLNCRYECGRDITAKDLDFCKEIDKRSGMVEGLIVTRYDSIKSAKAALREDFTEESCPYIQGIVPIDEGDLVYRVANMTGCVKIGLPVYVAEPVSSYRTIKHYDVEAWRQALQKQLQD